jgi:hypothetical protein
MNNWLIFLSLIGGLLLGSCSVDYSEKNNNDTANINNISSYQLPNCGQVSAQQRQEAEEFVFKDNDRQKDTDRFSFMLDFEPLNSGISPNQLLIAINDIKNNKLSFSNEEIDKITTNYYYQELERKNLAAPLYCAAKARLQKIDPDLVNKIMNKKEVKIDFPRLGSISCEEVLKNQDYREFYQYYCLDDVMKVRLAIDGHLKGR